jgi:hypothetical protein
VLKCFFSTKQSDAATACCEIKMELLNLHQDFVYTNLVQTVGGKFNSKRFPLCHGKIVLTVTFFEGNVDLIKAGAFWTSGTDVGSEGVFGFGKNLEILPKTAKFFSINPQFRYF